MSAAADRDSLYSLGMTNPRKLLGAVTVCTFAMFGASQGVRAPTDPRSVGSPLGVGSSSSQVAPTPKPAASSTVPSWAEVLEHDPDPKVVTASDLLKRIKESGKAWKVRDKKSGIEMVLVPAGEFRMGMSDDDTQATSAELPSHNVIISKAFYMGRFEVTQEQWVKLMGENPSRFKTVSPREAAIKAAMASGKSIEQATAAASSVSTEMVSLPVEKVSWKDCKKFCDKGFFKLPTEAQWEYACRAGTSESRYDSNVEKIAWLGSNSEGKTHPVGEKLPNALGLHDMLGNVWEWCADNYAPYAESASTDPKGPAADGLHVQRGGSWGSNDPKYCRASCRAQASSEAAAHHNLGFRVVKMP